MGRQADHYLPIPGRDPVGYSLTYRKPYYRVRFVTPLGRRVERATHCKAKGDARSAAEAIVRNEYAAPAPPPDTWAAAMAHLEAVPDLRPKSKKAYRLAVAAVRRVYPGLDGPAAVTPQHAARFPALWAAIPTRSGPRSPTTVNSGLTHLRSLWRKHWKPAGYVASNPWPDVPMLNAPRGRRVRVPTESAVGELVEWMRTRHPGWPLPALFVVVKMLAGCRTLDLCRAKTADLTDAGLTLSRDDTKDRKDRFVSLPPDVVAQLRAVAGPTWIWEGATSGVATHRKPRGRGQGAHAGGYSPESWRHTVENLFREFNRKREPADRVRPHDLRARAMTTAARLLGSADAVARVLGCDPQTARHYIESSAYDERNAGVVEALRPPPPKK